MRFIQGTEFTPATPGEQNAQAEHVSKYYVVTDCQKMLAAFNVSGFVGTSAVIIVEGSVAVPPSGASLGPDGGWAPPEASWFPAFNAAVEVSQSITGDGTYPLGVGPEGFLFRWMRVRYTPTAVTSGKITCDVFIQGGA